MPGLPRLIAAVLLACSLNVVAQDSAGLAAIAARGSIHLGYREAAAPFTYLPAGRADPVGYTWDVCLGLVRSFERSLGKPLKVVAVPVTENVRVMLLQTGIVDIDCGAAPNAVSRQKQAAFSYTLFVNETRVLIRAADGLAAFEQLAGRTVVVLAGGPAERIVRNAALGRNIVLNYRVAGTPEEALAALGKGEADAWIGDVATLAVQRAGNPAYVLLEPALAVEPYALMLPPGNVGLKQAVDAGLAGMMRNGELAELYERWFVNVREPKAPALGLPMSEALRSALENPGDRPANN